MAIWDDFLRLLIGNKGKAPASTPAPPGQFLGKGDPAAPFFHHPNEFGSGYQPPAPVPQEPVAPSDPYGLSSGGGGGAPQQLANLSGVQSRLKQINDLYGQLYGGLEGIAKEKGGQLQDVYGQQVGNLGKSYAKQGEQLSNAYGARGLSDSSYYQNAQQDASDINNQELGNLARQQQELLANVGKYTDTTRAGLQVGQQQFQNFDLNPYQYASPDQVSNLEQQLQGQIGGLNTQLAGLGTQGQYVQDLNKIVPVVEQGTQQLAKQLQTLVTSGAPRFAKEAIAKGLIKASNLTDQGAIDYWQSYFQQLLGA